MDNKEIQLGILALGIVVALAVVALLQGGNAQAAAIFFAAIFTPLIAIRGYRNQKEEDHRAELRIRRQHIYERLVTSFHEASHWNIQGETYGQMREHWGQEALTLKSASGEGTDAFINAKANFDHAVEKLDQAAENHRSAELEYHKAHESMLPAASDNTLIAVNNFHRFYVEHTVVPPKEAKILYARMIIAMRKDSFEQTSLTVKEIAMNIPWTMASEESHPIDWDTVNDDGIPL